MVMADFQRDSRGLGLVRSAGASPAAARLAHNGAGGLDDLMTRLRSMTLCLTRLRTGFPPGRFLRLTVLALVMFGGSGAAAQAQTVLERVLARINASGIFVNAAQSGFGDRRGRINASITNLMGPPPGIGAATGATQAIAAQSIALGMLESVAIGATNAGDVILSVEVRPARAYDFADEGSMGGIPSASVMLFGESSLREARIDFARIDDLIALSMSVAIESWQSGSSPDATVAAMNMAANGGDVSARILTHVEGALLDARDATATALGAVNVGITRVIGER